MFTSVFQTLVRFNMSTVYIYSMYMGEYEEKHDQSYPSLSMFQLEN